MIKENGEIVRCPVCKSDKVIRVRPFDFVKQCENDDCEYYLNDPEKRRHQFSTGVHN